MKTKQVMKDSSKAKYSVSLQWINYNIQQLSQQCKPEFVRTEPKIYI